MCDTAIGLQRKEKIIWRYFRPMFSSFQTGQMVEGAVKFHRLEMFHIVWEKMGFA